MHAGHLQADVSIENLGGHKLPTAYPSRRAWLHVSVRDRNDRVVFESGAYSLTVRSPATITTADPRRFEPHYTEITSSKQVQIYEDVLGDLNGQVTTGLLTGVRYLKDNRLLPRGFDKHSPDKDIAVIGEALNDPNFTGGGDRVRYAINLGEIQGPIRVDAELCYQPIGYRWANNLKAYNAAAEPRRFTGFFDSMAKASSEVLAKASVSF